jgi:hypothetical protein
MAGMYLLLLAARFKLLRRDGRIRYRARKQLAKLEIWWPSGLLGSNKLLKRNVKSFENPSPGVSKK